MISVHSSHFLQVTATTLLPPLVDLTGETEIQLTKTVARNLKEGEYESKFLFLSPNHFYMYFTLNHFINL